MSSVVSRGERYKLKGALKKSGFNKWRLLFNGKSSSTGEERKFFIEFYVVNPALSPKESILGFKSKLKKNSEELQYLLAGTEAAQTASEEVLTTPSYVMVKAGSFGADGKHISNYYPSKYLKTNHTDTIVSINKGDEDTSILFTPELTRGIVKITYTQLNENPELLCSAGSMIWNLRFEKKITLNSEVKYKNYSWNALGTKTAFFGTVVYDGEEYSVDPESSLGYYDTDWGKDLLSTYFHMSSGEFVSQINGKQLPDSCFAVHGDFENNSVALTCKIGDEIVLFNPNSKKYFVNYECFEMPPDDDGVKLHWTLSLSDSKNVVDIDVFCSTDQMFVRDYECPSGGRKLLKVIGGGNGSGEIRYYHKVKKNLELIEHAQITKVLCEYGHVEYPEK